MVPTTKILNETGKRLVSQLVFEMPYFLVRQLVF